MSPNSDFLLSLFLKVCTSCCWSITNTLISLVAHKLHQIHMNNQDKITTRWSKIKVHRANSLTKSSYLVRFSADIFSPLVSFAYFLSCFFFYLISCLVFVLSYFFDFLFFLNKNIYILIHIQLCGWVSHFSPADFRKQDYFFWPDIVLGIRDHPSSTYVKTWWFPDSLLPLVGFWAIEWRHENYRCTLALTPAPPLRVYVLYGWSPKQVPVIIFEFDFVTVQRPSSHQY